MKDVVVIFPAYNEEKNIKNVLLEAKKYYRNIIVVDDGSKDKTFEIARLLVKDVIRHRINKGKAEAIKTALLKSLNKFRFFVIADSDGQYNIKDSLEMLKYLKKGYDIVFGYRDFSKMPFRHKLGNKFLRALFNVLYGKKLKDVACGYFSFNKNFGKKLVEKIHGGYTLEASVLLTAIKENFKLKQVKVGVKYKKVSTMIRGIRIVLTISLFLIKSRLLFF
ncbi:MAG: glycosyltransferase family 2 protein [Candidatus Aenigmarchaeota archaeon]|nr:glycosyltransferase family 2 protein [Candidatus Aenigmarchaeota archaeon]MDW8149028.1 glycosyltransferase family 2 protein [Candidatus Aenigmarchaeota archaeon]